MDASDAVSRTVAELADELSRAGIQTRLLGLPTRLLRLENGRFARVARVLNQGFFYVSLFVHATMARGRVTVVTVDVPSGIGLVSRFVATLTRRRVTDIAWVMDLYRVGRDSGAGKMKSISDRARSWLELSSLRRATKVVVLGQCMEQRVSRLGVIQSTVVPLWGTPDALVSPRRETKQPLRLLYSGSAREIHPLVELVEAVAAAGELVELRVFGRGSEIERVAKLAAQLGARNIEVGQPVPYAELARHYGWADLHIVSLAGEATGTCVPSKTYAAMARGRAVLYLGERDGQAAQDISQSGGGIVVKNEAAAIRDALARLAALSAALPGMGEAGRAFIAEQRTVAHAAEAWAVLLSS
ncbi:glycosyltransferase [Microbacterium arborescens]